MKEICQVGRQVEDPKQRYRMLSSSLYSLRHLPRHQIEPIVAMLQDTAALIDDEQFLISTRESLILAAPEVATQIAQQMQNPRRRDHYLTDVVRTLAKTSPKQAEELIKQIQTSRCRSEAMALLAQFGNLGYKETTELLASAVQEDRAPHGQPLWSIYAESLLRFAVDRPEDVAGFVAGHLAPEHAVWCFCNMGWRLLHPLKRPDAAGIVLDRAAELIPKTPAPHKLVPRLIGSGYGQLRPERALEMFDRLVLPNIPSRELGYEYALASLAAINMETLIDRGKRMAEGRRLSVVEIVPRAIGRAAHETGRDRVLAWLRKTPPGPTRDASIRRVAWHLRFRAREESPENVQEWSRTLWQATQDVRDPKAKWQACSAILGIAESGNTEAPKEVEEEFRRLWVDVRDQLDEDDRRGVTFGIFGFLPAEEQRQWIRRWLEDDHRDRFWYATTLLRQSTLPEEEKRELCRQFIEEAQGNRLALSLLAQCVASLDLEWALDLIWKALPAVRNPDRLASDIAEPPENAEVALNWVLSEDGAFSGPSEEMLSKEDLPDILWSFAKRVPDVDRDAVLERLAQVLLRRGQTAEALGVARLIEDPPRRVRLLAEIAAELNHSGNRDEAKE